ncbi:MAG: glycosyl transferase [Afipia sp.]|nr:glycosyl transferase [Afipia sp.]
MIAAVRHPKLARPLADLGVEILKAPPWPEASWTKAQRAGASSATLGETLASAGLADEEALTQLLEEWTKILLNSSPDLVVADFAPAVALAARGRIPLMTVGNGFTLPPSDMTRFPLLHRKTAPVFEEMRLLTAINKASATLGLQPIERLPQLFSGDEYAVETFPLLDPYDLQRTEPVFGPWFERSPLAQREDADEIVVYLAPGYAIRRDLIGALLPFAKRVQIYAPSLSLVQRGRLKLAGVRQHYGPFDLADATTSARLVVHLGGSGVAAHALVAGVPQFIIAAHIEQELNGQALEREGVGKLVKGYETDTSIAAGNIQALLNDTALAQNATLSGNMHRKTMQGLDPAAAFEAKSRKLLGL